MLNFLYRIGRVLYERKLKFFSKFIYYIQCLACNSSVPHSVFIGNGTKFAYGGIATVIHERTIIGNNCIIGQGVTIGGRSKHYDVPIVGNNVYIGAGARVLGPITIGDDSIIAPNAVVIKNVEARSIVGGVPASVLKTDINISDFI
ncbi:serine acetyltransferase [Photobacterium frigidiphilum]|uniref:serine O-acetyltransferase n=1 Tax=Photobacterium frigidiphilum TaxID=264736 RepID=UPI003D0EB457